MDSLKLTIIMWAKGDNWHFKLEYYTKTKTTTIKASTKESLAYQYLGQQEKEQKNQTSQKVIWHPHKTSQ